MRIGIDVGGTHTDAVLIQAGAVIAVTKESTNHANLVESIGNVVKHLLKGVDSSKIRAVSLSTTLTTNAIVQNKLQKVAVVVSAGPGITPEWWRCGDFFYEIAGSIDHRGQVVAPLDTSTLQEAVNLCKQNAIEYAAFISKFSPRNPTHEVTMAEAFEGTVHYASVGHQFSGQLNFPRRIATAYYNSAVWKLYNDFANAVDAVFASLKITAPINILKADAGTMPLLLSRQMPVESIFAGPSASALGIMALVNPKEDCITLDIGGSTTDIAIFANGSPIIQKEGSVVGKHATLVRAIKTKSIGMGGDSRLHLVKNTICVGPDRVGPAMAAGGAEPTLTDIFNLVGKETFGDVNKSLEGLKKLAKEWNVSVENIAQVAIKNVVKIIKKATQDLIDEINSQPVYTLSELLDGRRVDPRSVYIIGGPAVVFAPFLEESSAFTVHVPEYSTVANAIGAARALTTSDLILYADTAKQTLTIPSLGIQQTISGQYSLEQAKADAMKALKQQMTMLDVDISALQFEITEASRFAMIEDDSLQGHIIQVRCQALAGILEA